MSRHKGSVSVWPGYVAAVSSLVLSLLLLAGVLVVAITQIGQVAQEYNDQLVVAFIEDERRIIAVESLLAEGREADRVVDITLSRQRASSGKSLATSPVVDPEPISARELEIRLSDRNERLVTVQAELAKLQSDRAVKSPERQQRDTVRFYRFVFGPGVQGLDDAVLEQLQARMRADGVAATSSTWVLETGVAGLDSVASREMYRLMLNIRTQLVEVGFSPEQVNLILNRDLAPQELPGARSQLRPGELPMLLKPITKPVVAK